ncbi:MAG: hypothetical protein P8Y71_23510 [Pseudolabrys sp.]
MLLFYQSKITNATIDKDAYAEIKQMGAALISTMRHIPFYDSLVWLRVFGLPYKNDVLEAAREFNLIVYSLGARERQRNSAAQNTKALQKNRPLIKN